MAPKMEKKVKNDLPMKMTRSSAKVINEEDLNHELNAAIARAKGVSGRDRSRSTPSRTPSPQTSKRLRRHESRASSQMLPQDSRSRQRTFRKSVSPGGSKGVSCRDRSRSTPSRTPSPQTSKRSRKHESRASSQMLPQDSRSRQRTNRKSLSPGGSKKVSCRGRSRSTPSRTPSPQTSKRSRQHESRASSQMLPQDSRSRQRTYRKSLSPGGSRSSSAAETSGNFSPPRQVGRQRGKFSLKRFSSSNNRSNRIISPSPSNSREAPKSFVNQSSSSQHSLTGRSNPQDAALDDVGALGGIDTSAQLNADEDIEPSGSRPRNNKSKSRPLQEDRSQKEKRRTEARNVPVSKKTTSSSQGGAIENRLFSACEDNEDGTTPAIISLRKTIKSLQQKLKILQKSKLDSDDHALELSKKLEAYASGKEFAIIKFTEVAGIPIKASKIEEFSDTSSSDSMFVGLLLMRLYGSDRLLTMSATGQRCRRFSKKTNPDGTPAYPATERVDSETMTFLCNKVAERNQIRYGPSKIATIREASSERKIRSYITQKLSNVKRAHKIRELNQNNDSVSQGEHSS